MDLRGYWWTCVAHQTTPGARIITPAQSVACNFETGYTTAFDSSGSGQEGDWHRFAVLNGNFSFHGHKDSWQHDNSFLGNTIQPNDFFARIKQPTQPFIAHVDEEGYAVNHVHKLNGTKFFTWGQNGPGRFMQDFLAGGEVLDSAERVTDYTELQIGPAPTQMNTFPVAKQSVTQWTDYYTTLSGAAELLNDSYSAAVQHVQANGLLSDELFAENDNWLAALAEQPVADQDIVQRGLPWGALELALLRLDLGSKRKREPLADPSDSFPLAPGLLFPYDDTQESRPWAELVGLVPSGEPSQKPGDVGTFSAATLNEYPTSYQTTQGWITALEASAAKYNGTWLHHLFLGVAQAEQGLVKEPTTHFEQSLALRADNPVAVRCLAVLQTDPEQAYELFIQAWELALKSTDPSSPRIQVALAQEIATFVNFNDNPAQNDTLKIARLQQLLAAVSPEVARNDNVLMAQLEVWVGAAGLGKYDLALDLLSKECFPTVGSFRPVLKGYWYTAQQLKAEAGLGRPLTLVEARNNRKAYPSPRNIGCAYAGNFCSEYW